MYCRKCTNQAVIILQHGPICKNHFINYFEEKVFKTINKYQLIGRDEHICVAASGGKDSLTALYLIKKYLKKNNLLTENMLALAIDEGIKNYRKKTLSHLKKFCKEQQVPLKIVSFKKEFGEKMDRAFPKINRKAIRKPCTICGVWRRYLLNKYAKKWGSTVVVTGHNLDDESQAIMMNIFKANTKLAGRLGPKTGTQERDFFIQRVKPLYFCTEKEVCLYALLKGFRIDFAECPYSKEGYRFHIQEMLNQFENQFKGTKQGIINSFLDILPLLKEREKNVKISQCRICKEPANNQICKACKIKKLLK